MNKPKIFNLSNKVLFQQHVNVHRTPLPDKIELKNDVQQFSSKLRLLEFSYKENELEEEKSNDSIIKKQISVQPSKKKR